ncbi:glycosyltransferase [Bifidobacterium avesanii]|uniref:Multidrug MFS transporter n=1 Tax=Bifidobacterium avesanii TaxID=1798157 RepID=A0A7K3TJJ8_9BIFI|nr:glycosyltransferase [Bifidobacterium avesanii]NEG79201.1 multidrug MFS transporter [Bifidobacterium avesanii]
MIFVTVGTHEQAFNRLIRAVDELKGNGIIQEPVIMQTGYCTYEPKHCQWNKFLSYDEMKKNVDQARIVISHGGPSSFLMPLKEGKIPIVMPRKSEYNEHVNDHQVDFVQAVKKRYNNIIAVYETPQLKESIIHYNEIISKMNNGVFSHNKEFCSELEQIINTLFAE